MNHLTKCLKRALGICLLIAWLAPAAALWFDTFAWLLTGHAPVGEHIQTDPLARISLTIIYTFVMLFITAGIGKLFYDN